MLFPYSTLHCRSKQQANMCLSLCICFQGIRHRFWYHPKLELGLLSSTAAMRQASALKSRPKTCSMLTSKVLDEKNNIFGDWPRPDTRLGDSVASTPPPPNIIELHSPSNFDCSCHIRMFDTLTIVTRMCLSWTHAHLHTHSPNFPSSQITCEWKPTIRTFISHPYGTHLIASSASHGDGVPSAKKNHRDSNVVQEKDGTCPRSGFRRLDNNRETYIAQTHTNPMKLGKGNSNNNQNHHRYRLQNPRYLLRIVEVKSLSMNKYKKNGRWFHKY